MKAKDMFKDLGYCIYEESEFYIVYKKVLKADEIIIEFHNSDKSFSKYRARGVLIRDLFITIYELKAINKQIEELEWCSND